MSTTDKNAFDTVVVVTDRRILDQQIRETIKQFAQVSATIGAVTEGSGQLREFIEGGKKIIISTVQKFPFILDELGSSHRDRNFAIVIDEAHSSQGGRATAALNQAFAEGGAAEEDETVEDAINRLMESRKLLPNASYFAFTATPKNKTLEIFGEPVRVDGETEAPAVPHLLDEAGDPGGLHPRRARELHAGRQLLPARQDGRERPGVRRQARTQEAAALRREQRPRDPGQGRDHGRPLPRAGARAEQDRRRGARDGRLQRASSARCSTSTRSAPTSSSARAPTARSSRSRASRSTRASRSPRRR